MINNKGREILCDVCGNFFQCNGTTGSDCWCMELENKTIGDQIKDCICRDCLIKSPVVIARRRDGG